MLNVEAMLFKFILMMPKTQVKNQESSKFQESKSRSIKNQDSSKESREDSIKISIKRVFQNIE